MRIPRFISPSLLAASRALMSVCLAVMLMAGAFSGTAYAETIVGVIMTGDVPYYQRIHEAFVKELGSDAKVVLQKPTPEPMSWVNAARKLVVIGANVIVAYGAPATLTVMKETSDIPILYAGVYDPAAMDISGKNATGISSQIPMDQLIKNMQSVKSFATLGVVFSKVEKDTILQVRELKQLESSMQFKMVLYDSRKQGYAADIADVDAILMTTSCSAVCGTGAVVAYAEQHAIPTGATLGGTEELGILLTMTANPEEQGRTVGSMAKKIIGGQSVSSVPPEAPKTIDFIVNLKQANAMKLTIPDSILAAASRVIK